MKTELVELRRRCPLPVLMNRLGLEQYVKSSCRSPFRTDEHASWGIYERNGRWKYKDFATGESGDEIGLLAEFYKLDQKGDFPELLEKYAKLANGKLATTPLIKAVGKETSDQRPSTTFLKAGTDEQISKLSLLRTISAEGLKLAHYRGVLRFGVWQGLEVYGVMDRSGLIAEVRRLDGALFNTYRSIPEHKSHTLRFSRKNWPLGILEALECAAIALVEGMPDFLAMHQFIAEESMLGQIAPVAMLSGSCDIASYALEHFAGKNIRIFPHLDQPGIDAAERWQKQLLGAKATTVDFFNFGAFEIAGQSRIKDLCDFNQQRGQAGFQPQTILNDLV